MLQRKLLCRDSFVDMILFKALSYQQIINFRNSYLYFFIYIRNYLFRVIMFVHKRHKSEIKINKSNEIKIIF